MRHNRGGFSLVEITIVLLVLSVLAAGGLSVYQHHDSTSKTAVTLERIEAIERAFADFRSAQHRLPCPADPTLREHEAGFGAAGETPGHCRSGAVRSYAREGRTAVGTVPTRALGLPDSHMYDGWGRRFTYYVDSRVTAPMALLEYGAANTCVGSIHVVNRNASTLTERAIYALVSHGLNGHGAFLPSGERRNANSSNAAERANAGVDTALNDDYSAPLVTQRPTRNTGDYTDSFDDIVRYKVRWAFLGGADSAHHINQSRERFVALVGKQAAACGITQRNGKFRDGMTYCWGSGYNLGIGIIESIVRLPTPVAMPAEVDFFHKISSSWGTVCAIGNNMKAYCWGHGSRGQLGNGEAENSNIPVEVQMPNDFEGWDEIWVGGANTCARSVNGRIFCWGRNEHGQLGIGRSGGFESTPVAFLQPTDDEIVTIIPNRDSGDNGYHTCGLTQSGKAYCWGSGGYGAIGHGSNTGSNVPVAVSLPTDVMMRQLTVEYRHSCGLGRDAKVYCWGQNHTGNLGDGTRTNRNIPVAHTAPAAEGGYTAIAVGRATTCASTAAGNVYCWGQNQSGETGDGTFVGDNTLNQRLSPVKALTPEGVIMRSIHVFGATFCATAGSGQPYCWGHGTSGKLGVGAIENSNIPLPMILPRGVKRIEFFRLNNSSFSDHICGIGDDGQAYCWGSTANGRTGTGSNTGVNSIGVPTQVVDDRFTCRHP